MTTTLTNIFQNTDNVAYGVFKLQKKTGAPIHHAKFYVDGHEINIPPRQKEMMALLISQQGRPVNGEMLKEALPDSKFSAGNVNLLTVQISYLRSAISKQLDGRVENDKINDILQCIEALGPNKKAGIKSPTRHSENKGHYKLLLLE